MQKVMKAVRMDPATWEAAKRVASRLNVTMEAAVTEALVRWVQDAGAKPRATATSPLSKDIVYDRLEETF